MGSIPALHTSAHRVKVLLWLLQGVPWDREGVSAGRTAPGCAGTPQGGEMRFGHSLCVLSPSLTLSQHPLHWIPGEFPFLGSSALLEPGTLLTQTLRAASSEHFVLSLFPPSTCSSKGTPVLPASSVCCYGNCCHK